MIRTCDVIVTNQTAMKRGNFKKKYISINTKSHMKTIIPGVF